MLASCGKGASVSYREIRNRLEPATVFASDGKYKSYTETLTYYDENGNDGYSYSVCIEPASDNAYGYNIIQKDSKYSVYLMRRQGICRKRRKALLCYSYIRNLLWIYRKLPYMFSRLWRSFVSSALFKKSDDGVITVAYEAKMTIEVAAKYSSMGFEIGDSLLATYEIYGDYITDEISYTLKKQTARKNPCSAASFHIPKRRPADFHRFLKMTQQKWPLYSTTEKMTNQSRFSRRRKTVISA